MSAVSVVGRLILIDLGTIGCLLIRCLGTNLAAAEALGDGAAVLLTDAVQVEAALIDLGLDRGELVLGRADRVAQAAARAASLSPGTCSRAGRTKAWLVSVRVSRLRLSDHARRARG